jgi:hypothetical protein
MSMSLALATGDHFGAFLSVVSMVPYGGDLIAKPVKAVKASKTFGALTEEMGKVSTKLAKAQKLVQNPSAIKIDASKKASKITREKRATPDPITGKTPGNCKYGTNIPTRGTWSNPADPGNCVWRSDAGHVVPYEKGYPDFEKAYMEMPDGTRVPATIPGAKVELPDVVGKHHIDSDAADKAMQDKLGTWNKPDNYVWHHHEDGTTMILVRQDFNHGPNGANHYGGAAVAKDPEY